MTEGRSLYTYIHASCMHACIYVRTYVHNLQGIISMNKTRSQSNAFIDRYTENLRLISIYA